MKSNAQQFSAKQAARKGWVVKEDHERVFALKGIGLILRIEIFKDGSSAIDGWEAGIALCPKNRVVCEDQADLMKNAA